VGGAEAVTRSGFVAIAGRPNVGKSTLINALVGAKVAIVSDKPQTTRAAIRGVATGADWQLVLVDLPGVQRPRDALTERMQAQVERELAEADAALLLINGEQGVGPGDRFIARTLSGAASATVTIAVNKIDRISRAQEVETLVAAAQLVPEAEVFPLSARTGAGIGPLREHLIAQLPQGPFLYERAQRTDVDRETLLAELIREQVLRRTFNEIPHAVGVVVEYVEWPRSGEELASVRALIWVETESQKGILIGTHGSMVKSIGTAARKELERELGARVHLDLAVRVRRRWRADDALLDRLGIE
jgi:GTP-binding protein Era